MSMYLGQIHVRASLRFNYGLLYRASLVGYKSKDATLSSKPNINHHYKRATKKEQVYASNQNKDPTTPSVRI